MDNIELAYRKAKLSKTNRNEVQIVERDKENMLKEIQNMLINHTFTTSPYRTKEIFEPKRRLIYILPFYPDRIIHHCCLNILIPIWEKLMIKDSYSCRKGKGPHAGSMRTMEFVVRNKYCWQGDVRHFYPSIVHDKMYSIICSIFKDPDVLWILKDIIYSIPGGKNCPIGNSVSQWFGNLYLTMLDRLIKYKFGIHDYIRYCDDFLIFGNDKYKLKNIGHEVENFLNNELFLELRKKSLYKTRQGVDFLGYRHFPDRKILVRKSTSKRMKKAIRAIPYLYENGFITAKQALSKVSAIKGWIKHANTHNFKISLNLDCVEEKVRTYQ